MFHWCYLFALIKLLKKFCKIRSSCSFSLLFNLILINPLWYSLILFWWVELINSRLSPYHSCSQMVSNILSRTIGESIDSSELCNNTTRRLLVHLISTLLSTIISKRRVCHQVWWFFIKRRYLSKALLQSGHLWRLNHFLSHFSLIIMFRLMSMAHPCCCLLLPSWMFILLNWFLTLTSRPLVPMSHSTLNDLLMSVRAMSTIWFRPLTVMFHLHLVLIIDFRSSLKVSTGYHFIWERARQESSLEVCYFLALYILHESRIL